MHLASTVPYLIIFGPVCSKRYKLIEDSDQPAQPISAYRSSHFIDIFLQ